MTHFYAALREAREAAGLSQMKLAELAGMTNSGISRLEKPSREPARETVLKLADALEFDWRDRDRLLWAAGFAPASEYVRGVVDAALEVPA